MEKNEQTVEMGGSEQPLAVEEESADLKKEKKKHGPFPGDDNFNEKHAPIGFVINEWAQGTSIHGVPFVTDAITWKLWKRMVWLVLVLVSTGFFLWQCDSLIQEYQSYKVLTDTETINPPSLEFPEITICNMNPFSQSRINQTNITDPKNDDEIRMISTPLEEFIIRTWFNGKELDVKKSWKSKIIQVFAECWSFETDERVSRPGYYSGLKVWADLNQADYERESAEFAGILVLAQMPGSYLSSHLPVFAVKPGKEALISMRKTEFQRERVAPWSRCHSEAPQYTQAACRDQCLQNIIQRECGCRRWGANSSQEMRYCSRYDPEEYGCVERIFNNEALAVYQSECDCELPPCKIIKYDGKVAETNRAQVWLDGFEYEKFNTSRQDLIDNFVGVTINFDEIQYDLLTESKAMSQAELLGAIGGSMGFFLGISMISVFEVFGDLALMRLFPRLFGRQHLLGLGTRAKED